MGIPIALLLLMFQYHNYLYKAYGFERDVSQVVGVGATKEWLVFMEMEIKHCIRTKQMPHYPWADLVGLIRCMTLGPEPPMQCYVHKRRWKVHVGCHNRYRMYIQIHQRKSSNSHIKYRNTDSLIFNALVHGVFNINVTFLHFLMSDEFGMYPPQNDCSGSPVIFKTEANGHPFDYCGVYYPWSMYFAKNRVSLKLDLRTENTDVPGDVHVVIEIGVVDKHIFLDKYDIYTGLMTWSGFKVQWYRINVEMLYRVKIHAFFVYERKSEAIIYDGPNANMPKISNHKYQSNETITSSTFQIFVVHVSKGSMETSTLIFKAFRDKPIILKPPQQMFLRNNSGCGVKSTKTWMCTYHIFAPVGTHSSLKVKSLDIIGPFRNMYVSAGVAIYNVINQNRSLVAHWHMSIDSDYKEFVITSTENELYMTVFAYSPFAVLSYHFSIESGICIGRFIGKFMRPSLLIKPLCSRSSLPIQEREQCFVQINLTRECLVVQLIFLPFEFPLSKRLLLSLVFVYEETVHIWKDYVGPLDKMPAYSCRIYGEFNSYQGQIFWKPVREIIGTVDDINCRSASNSIMNIIKIDANKCLLPCQAANIPLVTVGGNDTFCDICMYEWIHKGQSYSLNYLPSYGSIKFERLYDNLIFPEICIVSLARSFYTGHEYCYYSSHTALTFSEPRKITAKIYNADVWRIEKFPISNHYHYDHTFLFVSENPVFVRFGAYEYILKYSLLNDFGLGNWSMSSYECNMLGAQLLTIFDRRELNFIIKNIMIPFTIDQVFIGMQRQVRKSR